MAYVSGVRIQELRCEIFRIRVLEFRISGFGMRVGEF